jgi:hypothetical protein
MTLPTERSNRFQPLPTPSNRGCVPTPLIPPGVGTPTPQRWNVGRRPNPSAGLGIGRAAKATWLTSREVGHQSAMRRGGQQ